MSQQDDASSDTFRILIATDNHLGYLEKDPVRGNDSFITFEEILQQAKKLKVDFVLLGGDLFHDNKPSRSTLYRTMELLRTYCFGDRPVNIEIMSDQSINFSTKFGCVNYEDPNFNVEIPIFSIHGNHDDPAGEGGLASLDLLAVCNLVNYFGKSDNIDDVTIYPMLMRKGVTKLSIYGLGNIRDERLYRTFQQKKVKLMRPVEARDEWFNIFVLHQNRVAHSPKNYIHEVMLDNFLDFVVWGHEHECLITPQPSTVGAYYITQPGSSVATALSEGESKKKHVGILEICRDQFRLKPIALETVRPFIMEEIILSAEELESNDSESIIELLANKVEEMIAKAETESKNGMKPLIRLKVEYTGFATINPQRFGQRFVGRVANPNEILLFYKKRSTSTHKSKDAKDGDKDLVLKSLRPDPLDTVRVEDLIESFLGHAQSLEILLETELHNALHSFVEKDDKSAIAEFVTKTLTNTQKYLREQDPAKTVELEAIQNIVSERTASRRAEENKDKDPYPLKDEDMDMGADEHNEDEPMRMDDEEDEEELTTKKKGKKTTTTSKATSTTTAKGKKGASTASTTTTTKGKKAAATKPTNSKYSLQLTDTTSNSQNSKSKSYSKTTNKKDPVVDEGEEEGENEDEELRPPVKKIKSEPLDEEKPAKRRITSILDVLQDPSSKKKTTSTVSDQNLNEDDSANDTDVTKWGKRKK